ncbi:HNH endonuclease [Pseudoalteromonas galatheae]|uniref:HNH endonuclease n=2 Tax=Pseudoalteromonas galatheae TaxID=579562 RepID=UPI0030CD1ECD
MPSPDFKQKTIDTLAKRASFICSNPDCRVSTVGPNSDPAKSTLIGEAAHIRGARPTSKRFMVNMTNASRAEITNGIWLCRNCHKLIDSDENQYSVETLFAWREGHEKFVLSALGNSSDKLELAQQESLLSIFEHYPPIIRRIVIDKPDGWEWRLASELMRYFNEPQFKKIRDLRGGFYIKERACVSQDEVMDWIQHRLTEASQIVSPIEKLLDRLTLSFGEPGEAGDIYEIHHVCGLIRDYISEVIRFEESLHFSVVPENAKRAVDLLKNCISSQVEKLESVPNEIDEAISLAILEDEDTDKEPRVIEKTITFELPNGWEKKMRREILNVERSLSVDTPSGCSSWLLVALILLILGVII